MHKIYILFAAIAAILITAPLSLGAAERAYLQSTVWEDQWEPCFKDRPADRIVSMRAIEAAHELYEDIQNAVDQNIDEETAAALHGAKMNRMLDDFQSVANHGCGVAQAMMAMFYKTDVGRIREDRLESLKWMSLAVKSGSVPAQNILKRMLPDYSAEDITTARAWVDAWRPSD